MSTLTTVHLVGSLGRAPGIPQATWHLDVRSTAEAIRAIDINTRGALTRYLRGPARDRLYKVALQKRDNVIDAKEIPHRSGNATIYIMPTVRGRNSGVGKIVAGVVLTVLAVVSQQYELLPYAWGGVGTGAWVAAGSIAFAFGTSLILGGIAQLLTPKPEGPSANPDQAQSTSFPGNAGAVVQGGCIPVVYGRALVSPIPVSITVTNNDVSTTQAGNPCNPGQTSLRGGGTQYTPSDEGAN